MASRAVAKLKVDWSKIAEQVSKDETPMLNKLKSVVDGNAVKVASLPDSLPKIDWAYYKAHASDPKLVEEIEKKYSVLKVEPPKAPAARLAEIDRAQEQDEARFKKFTAIAQQYVEAAEVVKQKFANMIPVGEMSFEDWSRTFPKWAPGTIDNPSIFPHFGRTVGLSREEQIAFEQPDPLPYATKRAWKDWEERKKKFYS